jgi:hypothetical protein
MRFLRTKGEGMDSPDHEHLTADELLIAVVDAADLDAGQRRHLAGCERCMTAAKAFGRDFDRLGDAAKHLAPRRRRTFRLTGPAAFTREGWLVKPALVAALAGLLVLALLRFPQPKVPMPARGPLAQAETQVTALDLMRDVDRLVADVLPDAYRPLTGMPVEEVAFADLAGDVNRLIDNALPERYRHLAAAPETDVDETFMPFIIPVIEMDASPSVKRATKGAVT